MENLAGNELYGITIQATFHYQQKEREKEKEKRKRKKREMLERANSLL
jgi:hypothetical protein